MGAQDVTRHCNGETCDLTSAAWKGMRMTVLHHLLSTGLPLEEGAGEAEVTGVEAPASGFAFVHQLAQELCRGAGESQCLQDPGAVWALLRVLLRALLLHTRAAELGEVRQGVMAPVEERDKRSVHTERRI